jgi:hypothetical protein
MINLSQAMLYLDRVRCKPDNGGQCRGGVVMLMQTDVGTPGSAHVIVLGNEKGGSGKSTTAMHVAVALLQAGQRVARSISIRARRVSPITSRIAAIGPSAPASSSTSRRIIALPAVTVCASTRSRRRSSRRSPKR